MGGWIATLAFVSVTSAALPAVADEPSGFADLPWGTGRAVIEDQCPGEPSRRGPEGVGDLRDCWIRPVQIGGNSYGASFMFQPRGALSGYSIRVDAADYRDLKDEATARFGPGHEAIAFYGTSGGMIEGVLTQWAWPSGTSAWLEEVCDAQERACLVVTHRAYVEWATSKSRPEREGWDGLRDPSFRWKTK